MTTAGSSNRLRVVAGCALAALVLLPTAFVAWRSPTTEVITSGTSSEVANHTLALTVTGIAAGPSLLYPAGRSEVIAAQGPVAAPVEEGLSVAGRSGDEPAAGTEVPAGAPPLFRTLIETVEIDVSYALDGASAVSGVAHVDARMVTGRGYTVDLRGLGQTSFEETFSGTVTIDLADIERRRDQYLAAAGLTSDTVRIEVRPAVVVDATVPGGDLEQATVSGDPLVLDIASDAIVPSGTLLTVSPVAAGVSGATTQTASASLFGIRASVTTVRLVTTLLLIVLLGMAALLLRAEDRERPAARINLLYRSLLVDVVDGASPGGEPVRVASMAELARLARRDHRSILHQVAGGRNRYLVPDGDLTYEYVLEDEDEDAVEPAAAVAADQGPSGDAAVEPSVEPAPAPVAHPQGAAGSDPVVVGSFAELTRLWVAGEDGDRRMGRRSLAGGGVRYVLNRGSERFVYDAAEGEDIVGVRPKSD